jgi:hypothetical protein
MGVTGDNEIRAVLQAVNQGIDTHLEACFVRERGDDYTHGQRKIGELVLCSCLDCVVSPESMPVLLRRLYELEGTYEEMDAAISLADGILTVLGINQFGDFVGREALGL